MNEDNEVMAVVRYDFPSASYPGIQIAGAVTFRRLSEAQKAVETLNKEYGEGSHWVEPSNYTYAEMLASWH